MTANWETLCDLDRKGRIVVGGAVRVGVDQSMFSSNLTLSPVLLQEECKHLSKHSCHSFLKIGVLNFNWDWLIWRGDRNTVTKFHVPEFDNYGTVKCLVLMFISKINSVSLYMAVHWMTYHYFRTLHKALWWKFVCLEKNKRRI